MHKKHKILDIKIYNLGNCKLQEKNRMAYFAKKIEAQINEPSRTLYFFNTTVSVETFSSFNVICWPFTKVIKLVPTQTL